MTTTATVAIVLSGAQMASFNIPKLLIVVTSAIVTSLNPCTIGLFILVASALLGAGRSTKRLMWFGAFYISAFLAACLIVTFGTIGVLNLFSPLQVGYGAIVITLVALAFGLMYIKDYFWYGKGISLQISQTMMKRVQSFTKQQPTLFGAILLGFTAAVLALPCTGITTVVTMSILRVHMDTQILWQVILYNLLLITPLIATLSIVHSGTGLTVLQKWKENNKANMRLALGLITILLGWLLLLLASGMLNVG